MLGIAIAKTSDPDQILRAYAKRDGMRNVARILFERPGLSALQTRFQTGFNLFSIGATKRLTGQA